MTKTIMKEIFISMDKKSDFQFFLEMLTDALKHADFSLSSKHGGLKIRFYGEKSTVNDSIRITKSLSKIFIQSTQADRNGFYVHDLKLLQMTSKKIISLESISTVLNHNGFPSRVENRLLITKASLSKVRDIIDKLYGIIQQIPLYARSVAIKKVILTLCYTLNMVPDFIIEKGVKEGFFEETGDRILIRKSPEKCIEEMLRILSSEDSKMEYMEEYANGEFYRSIN
ncbi:MAG: DUF2067 family protein [Candidatus Heimdallarchaeaceae archaeon]